MMIMTRLMCSKDRNQVELVKTELSRAGILSEIRSNPLAAALRVTRLELWVPQEGDFTIASSLYVELQARLGEDRESGWPDKNSGPDAETGHPQPRWPMHPAERPVPFIEAVVVEPQAAGPKNNGKLIDDLEQASAFLEQDMEELLAREADLEQKCRSLQGAVKALTDSQSQAQIAHEIAARNAAEQKAAALANTQNALQRDLRASQLQLHSRDKALAAAEIDLDAKLQESRLQQAKIVDLKSEIASRDLHQKQAEQAMGRVQDQLLLEKVSRIAVEERAAKLAAAQQCLEQKLAEQTRWQEQLRAHFESLHSLGDRLHAKNSARSHS